MLFWVVFKAAEYGTIPIFGHEPDEFFVSESKARDYRRESKQVGAYGIPEAFRT